MVRSGIKDAIRSILAQRLCSVGMASPNSKVLGDTLNGCLMELWRSICVIQSICGHSWMHSLSILDMSFDFFIDTFYDMNCVPRSWFRVGKEPTNVPPLCTADVADTLCGEKNSSYRVNMSMRTILNFNVMAYICSGILPTFQAFKIYFEQAKGFQHQYCDQGTLVRIIS